MGKPSTGGGPSKGGSTSNTNIEGEPGPSKKGDGMPSERGRGSKKRKVLRTLPKAKAKTPSKEKTRSAALKKREEKEKNSEFQWNEKARDYREFTFAGTPGINVLPDDLSCPLSVVKLFLTDEIVESIVQYTNEYAKLIKQLPEE